MIFGNPLLPLALDLGSADSGVRLQAARQIAQQLPLPGFLETLWEQRLIPLIYQTLTRFTKEEVGKVPRLQELRRDYLQKLRGYKLQEEETQVLVRTLAEVGVEVILLKGADIRHRLYDDPVTRPMNDVDLLISPADLEKVRDTLGRKGYALGPWCLDPRPGFNSRFDYDITFATPSRTYPLDFHWELREVGTYYRLPYAPLRARAAVRDLNGLQALVLAPEHLLMHLCLHTFEELETAGILKIVDVDRALTRLQLDWDLFLKDAEAFQVQGPLLFIFREMMNLRPNAVPEFVWQRLAAYSPGWPERFVLRRRSMSLPVALLAALWRYVPLQDWPLFFQGKLWPSNDYLKANAHTFGNRLGHVRHLLTRGRDKT